MANEVVRTSRFLSLVLRHKPETIDLVLDDEGWAEVDHLLAQLKKHGREVSMDLLLRVVRQNDKQRFALNADETRIRASQGHSIDVVLGLEAVQPPDRLYHGTAMRFLDSIREQGLIRGQRQYVHLSHERETAVKVGKRHGKPAVLVVASAEMHGRGHPFFLSANGVWLCEHVPAAFIDFPE